MRGEKRIEFPFEFTHSLNGEFVSASSITVRAPGLSLYSVHTTMSAYVGEAVLAFTKFRAQMPTSTRSADQADDVDAPESQQDDEQDVMHIMSMGLGVEKYPAFAAFVKKTLTNQPRLATVGDTKAAITDEVWDELEKMGGMEAVQKIMSDFTGFFFERLGGKSKKPSGPDGSTTSGSPTRASSPTKQRATSRSPS